MKELTKKGQVMSQLGALGVGVATLVIILAVTFLVMAQVGTQSALQDSTSSAFSNCNTSACNATRTLTNAAATIPAWVPLIILVAIGGLILSLVAVFGQSKN